MRIGQEIAEGGPVMLEEGFATISTSAVRGLLAADVGNVDVYLPGKHGEGPVLYHGSQAAAKGLDVNRLRDHGVTHVCVNTDTLLKCEVAIEERLSDLLCNPNLPPGDKAEIVHTAGSFVARELLADSITSETLARASTMTDSVIEGLLRDPEVTGYLLQMAGHERSTASHLQMVSTLAIGFGVEVVGDDVEALRDLALAGLLHDVGKLSVPTEILQKAGPLSESEVHLLQQHPIESVRLIGPDAKVSPEVRQMILQHHERLDGRGYPLGLSGEDISMSARMLTIVDSFHAMIGPRSYRAQLSVADANRIMGYQAGRQFDEQLLELWLGLCSKRAPNTQPHRIAPEPASEERSVQREHSPAKRTEQQLKQRRPRYVCAGNTIVRCIYSGRLPEVSDSPDDFGASVFDVSKGGMCIHSAHPMYRGEIVHVRVATGEKVEWVRSMVAWCKAQEPNIFKVGLQFQARVPETDITEGTEVLPMGGVDCTQPQRDDEELDAERNNDRENASDEANATQRRPINSRRDDAMKRLAAIACMRRPNSEAQRTAIILSTSADVQIRLKALDVLVQIDTKATREALVALTHDTNREVKTQAVLAAGANRVHEAIPALRELLNDRTDEMVLTTAGALGAMGDWSGFRFVSKTLEAGGEHVRLAVRAFSQITGHRFEVNREGIESARRYLKARKKDLARMAAECAETVA